MSEKGGTVDTPSEGQSQGLKKGSVSLNRDGGVFREAGTGFIPSVLLRLSVR